MEDGRELAALVGQIEAHDTYVVYEKACPKDVLS